MHTIKTRLGILIFISVLAAISSTAILVNFTIDRKFNQYLETNQEKRNEFIVSYLREVYEKNGGWNSNSGVELIHEAYMSKYCLTLKDSEKNVIWEMSLKSSEREIHSDKSYSENEGLYQTQTFEIYSDNVLVGYVDVGQYSSVLMTEEDIEFRSSINKSIALSGLLACISVMMFSLHFSKQLSSPIVSVARIASLMSRGIFDAKSEVNSNISEIDSLNRNIGILGKKLKYQDEIRSRLVSDISHEIRTPLNILQNNFEAMIDGVLPVNNEKLAYLNEEVIRFGKMLDTLNTLKKFESESLKLELEKVCLSDLVKSTVQEFKQMAVIKEIELSYSIESGSDHSVIGDFIQLKQVLINLLSNALKFTECGGRVNVGLQYDKRKTVLLVEDNGLGISKKDLPFIFERLYRADKSRKSAEGNGIGLSIVKNILNLHNAEISIKSIDGLGTTAKIVFLEFPSSKLARNSLEQSI